MDLKVSWERMNGVLIASPAGRVDSVNSVAFREALVSEVPAGERALLLDLRDLSYMSSAGLSVLLVLAKRFRGSGKAMGMCGLPAAIAAVVTLSGFDKIIPVYDTRDAALETMSLPKDADSAHQPAEAPSSDKEADANRKRSGPRRWSFKMHSN
ncbi:MAG: STAS domain-containing protein [Gammaproteobacteria bacterium]|nr:STAS domain-containing protein [Gammaproteobacteria bacterium]MYF61860.1 STAS domain-containing protein [Gammaproteobacteria bacterium]MYI23303.1 STAS domain-containing protein [Gammaproteobacteria bacterium]